MALFRTICRGNSNARAAGGYRKGHRYVNPQVSSHVKIAGRARSADSLLFGVYTMDEDLYGSATLCSLSSPSLGMTGPLRQYF